MKYFLKRDILINDRQKRNTIPMDYPIFLAGTEEDLNQIQRNFVNATMKGFSPDFRKICATSSCNEGYTVRGLMETIGDIPEVSPEEYNLLMEIPHWNPIKKLFNTLSAYSSAVDQAQEESKKDGSDELLLELTEKYMNATTSSIKHSDAGLPDGSYTRG